MARHGLTSVSKAKQQRLVEAAEEEAAESMALEATRMRAHEEAVHPHQLAGRRTPTCSTAALIQQTVCRVLGVKTVCLWGR